VGRACNVSAALSDTQEQQPEETERLPKGWASIHALRGNDETSKMLQQLHK
jgi:hypothetical protein